MAADLITRLRKIAGHELDHPAAEAADEIEYLRKALRIVADGTLCPELFPALDLEKDVWELQAKTAMTSAIAALEHGDG